MPGEPPQSLKGKSGITTGVVETTLRWLAEIGAAVNESIKNILGRRHPESVAAIEKHVESTKREAEAITSATENAAAEPTTATSFAEPATADVKVSSDAQICPIAHVVPDQQEIQRRRDLVRTLFNDFWSGSDDKPAGFADRLNQAENYINGRLTAYGEFWQLDAKTRAILSLPPGSKPPSS
jgi:hypothetical protein